MGNTNYVSYNIGMLFVFRLVCFVLSISYLIRNNDYLVMMLCVSISIPISIIMDCFVVKNIECENFVVIGTIINEILYLGSTIFIFVVADVSNNILLLSIGIIMCITTFINLMFFICYQKKTNEINVIV